MQVPLEISGHQFSINDSNEALIREKAARLEKFYDRLTSCRVVIDGPSQHHKKGSPFRVRIHLAVPGNEITIDRHENPDLTAAIRSAFDAAERRLREFARTQRGDVKRHADDSDE